MVLLAKTSDLRILMVSPLTSLSFGIFERHSNDYLGDGKADYVVINEDGSIRLFANQLSCS